VGEGYDKAVKIAIVPAQAVQRPQLVNLAARRREEAARDEPAVQVPARQEPARDDEDEVTRRTPVPNFTNGEPRVVRLSPSGTLISGSGTSELAELAAYAAQMADLVGELLGIERFTTMELSLSDGACVIARQPNGDLVAVRGGRATDPLSLRKRAGL
jgi:hypothetical protein